MIIGIEQFREARQSSLDRMLLQPLQGPAGPYAIAWQRAA
jgi:hypothetical protein